MYFFGWRTLHVPLRDRLSRRGQRTLECRKPDQSAVSAREQWNSNLWINPTQKLALHANPSKMVQENSLGQDPWVPMTLEGSADRK